MKVTLRLAGAVTLAAIQVSAMAGVRMETVERDAKTGAEKTGTVMQIQDGRARVEAGGGTRASTIIFRDAAMYMIDTQRKSYMVFDRATVDRTATAMNDAMAQMRVQMESMPPEQRAMMENMMKQRGMAMPSASTKPAVFDAKATGGTEKAAGRDCKVWNVTRDGVLWEQVCVVSFSSLPGQDEFQAITKQMRTLFEKMGEAAKQFGTGPMQQDAALAGKLNGVPFITRRYRDGVLQPEEIVMKAWRTETVEAARFEIPAGFTKQEVPSLPARPR